MEHFGQKSHRRSLIGIILGKFQHQFEGPALPRSVVRAEDDRLPEHDVRIQRRAGDAAGGIVLQATEVAE